MYHRKSGTIFEHFSDLKKSMTFFLGKTVQQHLSQKENLHLLQVAFGEKIISWRLWLSCSSSTSSIYGPSA
jgi:hypothetical protein